MGAPSALIAAAFCASLVLGVLDSQETSGTVPDQASRELIGGIVWERDLGAARLRAADEKKPLLIVVRCPP